MTKAEIDSRLSLMTQMLVDTKSAASYSKGPVNDALQIVLPIFEEQVELMRAILESPAPYEDQ